MLVCTVGFCILPLMLAILPNSPINFGNLYVDCFGPSLYPVMWSVDNGSFPLSQAMFVYTFCFTAPIPTSTAVLNMRDNRCLVSALEGKVCDVSLLSTT